MYNAIFEREVYSMLIDSYLLVCETKAFKLDLAILLVNREPGKKSNQNRETTHLYEPSKKDFKTVIVS